MFSNIQIEQELLCKAETDLRRNSFEAAPCYVLITQKELIAKPGDRLSHELNYKKKEGYYSFQYSNNWSN